jgi:hypothetical protein
MAATRLNDAQKQELVSRFRGGAGTQELAAAYGCSPNTVTRVVKAAIEPALYEELKRQRGRRAGQAPAPEAPEQSSRQSALSVEPEEAPEPPADLPSETDPIEDCVGADAGSFPEEPVTADPPEANAEAHEAARGLAIDDADDFDDFDSEDDGEESEDDAGAGFAEQTFVEVPISLAEGLDQPLTTPRPWCSDELPASAYMLVDKTVELQARPLGEIPELGRLEAAELELQALVLYSNPRQAKRHCGRTQRVIKVPDVGVLERRASYLLRQGICRVVVEGALYALPES